MSAELKKDDLISSIPQSISKGLVALLTTALCILIYIPLYLAQDLLPEWAVLFLDPRLIISGVLLIALGVYICARTIRELLNKKRT